MSDCSHFAVLDHQIARPYLLWAVDAGLNFGRPPGQISSNSKKFVHKTTTTTILSEIIIQIEWSTCDACFSQLGFSRFDLVDTTTNKQHNLDANQYFIEPLLKKQQSILWESLCWRYLTQQFTCQTAFWSAVHPFARWSIGT